MSEYQIPPELKQAEWENCCTDLKKQLSDELERLQVALAGITGIAFGCGLEQAEECVNKRQWAFVPTMADVLQLRKKYESLSSENTRLREALEHIANDGMDARQCMEMARAALAEKEHV